MLKLSHLQQYLNTQYRYFYILIITSLDSGLHSVLIFYCYSHGVTEISPRCLCTRAQYRCLLIQLSASIASSLFSLEGTESYM